MPEIVGVQCPFREGEEEAAREFLAQPPTAPDLHIPSRILRIPYIRWVATIILPSTVLAYFMFWGEDGYTSSGFVDIMLFGLVFTVGVGGLLHALMWRVGEPLHVCGADGAIYQGRRKLASFDELGVPRRVCTIVEVPGLDGAPPDLDPREVIEFAHHRQEPLVLFRDVVPKAVRANMDAYAEHINAIIAEYHRRKAVRRWLEHRDAQSIPSRGYR